MAILMLFALVAGAGTAFTPCVLPVLPALLSASAAGGRRRPLGVVTGLAITYTIAIAALASVIHGVGLAEGSARDLAIVALLLFGLVLLVPRIGDLVEARLAPVARVGQAVLSARSVRVTDGRGFWSGLGIGAALGFLYAPCAGPILAAVISVSATGGSSLELVAVAISYSAGSAAVLLVFALASRGIGERVRHAGRGVALQRVLALVMIATAGLMLADLDVRFQTALANHFPDFLVNPTRAIERSEAVESRLADLRGRPKFDSERPGGPDREKASVRRSQAAELPVLGKAPEFRDTERWFNTGGRDLTLGKLRGRVVLIDFWTYTCINCIRTLPALKAWDARYRHKGLTIVGVHTPEFPFEEDAGNVRDAIEQNRLRYSIVQDNRYGTWKAWGNQYWPAEYLIDARGRVRHTHFGEGDYDQTEAAIRDLLGEAGHRSLGGPADPHPERPSRGLETPETYLGYARAERFLPAGTRSGYARYSGYEKLPLNHFALKGLWKASAESATAIRDGSLDARFGARKVFLVLSSRAGKPRHLRVLLDGKPIRSEDAGVDVHRGVVLVRRQRLYGLVSLPRVAERLLTLEFAPGISGYAFTFG